MPALALHLISKSLALYIVGKMGNDLTGEVLQRTGGRKNQNSEKEAIRLLYGNNNQWADQERNKSEKIKYYFS
jgi:hypothetical protein